MNYLGFLASCSHQAENCSIDEVTNTADTSQTATLNIALQHRMQLLPAEPATVVECIRGKVRLTLEFHPEGLEVTETPENGESQANKASSPLDDIRQMMPKDNKQNS